MRYLIFGGKGSQSGIAPQRTKYIKRNTETTENVKRKIHHFVEDNRGKRNRISNGSIPDSHTLCSNPKPALYGHGGPEFTHNVRYPKHCSIIIMSFQNQGSGEWRAKGEHFV